MREQVISYVLLAGAVVYLTLRLVSTKAALRDTREDLAVQRNVTDQYMASVVEADTTIAQLRRAHVAWQTQAAIDSARAAAEISRWKRRHAEDTARLDHIITRIIEDQDRLVCDDLFQYLPAYW